MLWINVFKNLFIIKVGIELSVNLKPKTVYTVYKMCSIYILGIFYACKIVLLCDSCTHFANSVKHGWFGSLLSVSPSIISTPAMLPAFSIIPEFMHYIEPDFSQYLSHCKCYEDVAYCKRQTFPEFLLTLCVEWWGVGDYTKLLGIIQRNRDANYP